MVALLAVAPSCQEQHPLFIEPESETSTRPPDDEHGDGTSSAGEPVESTGQDDTGSGDATSGGQSGESEESGGGEESGEGEESGGTQSCESETLDCPSCRNVLVNPGVETGDLTGWQVIEDGGDGTRIVTDHMSHDGTRAVATSSGDFTRSQEVDLVAAGFDPADLDDSPSVRAELWVREMFASDPWWLRVELRNANHEAIASWSDGGWTDGVQGYADDTWTQTAHTFADVPAGLRYVYFEDGGSDGENWAGNYGVKLDAAAVIVCD